MLVSALVGFAIEVIYEGVEIIQYMKYGAFSGWPTWK